MTRPRVAQSLIGAVPVLFLLVAFGRLVARPGALIVVADRPTVDQARVVDAPPGNDLSRQFLPLHRWVGREWRRLGRLPGWDDRGFGGRPLVGNPQAGLFYPPVWLAWLIPAPAVLGWITVGHLVGAILGTLRLTRTLGLSDPARVVAAGCFALNPYVLAHVAEGHYPHVWGFCWYPWAFDAVIRLTRRRERGSAPQLVGVLSVMALVGHPQEAYYLVLALVPTGLVLGLTGSRGLGSPRRRVAIAAVRRVPAVLGAGLLVLVVTGVETGPVRLAAREALHSARLSSREASRYHPTALNALQLLSPNALGGPTDYFGPVNYWETVVAVGLIPLILATVGAVGTPDRRRVAGWVALVGVAVVFAGGRQLGLFELMYWLVPGMDRFRVPARSLFLAALGASVLAGFGVDVLRRGAGGGTAGATDRPDGWRRWGRRWTLGLGLLAGLIGWGAWRSARLGLEPTRLAPTVAALVRAEARRSAASDGDRVALGLARLATDPVFLGAAGALTLVLIVGRVRPERRRTISVGLGLLGLAELAGSGLRVLEVAPAARFLDPGLAGRALARLCPTIPGQPPPRVRADAGVLTDLQAVELVLSKTDINESYQVEHAARLYERLFDLSRPRPADRDHPATGPEADGHRRMQASVLKRLGVVALVADATTPRTLALIAALGWPTERIAGEGPAGPVAIARDPDPLPLAYVVPRAAVAPDDDEAVVDRFAAVDPRVAVLMARDPLADLPRGTLRQGFRPADRLAAPAPDALVVEVATTAPGLLVVANTKVEGWTALVDGHPAPIERGNAAQQVIALPGAGWHRVDLTFEPPGYRRAAMGTAAGWVLWGLIGWVRRRGGGPGTARRAAT